MLQFDAKSERCKSTPCLAPVPTCLARRARLTLQAYVPTIGDTHLFCHLYWRGPVPRRIWSTHLVLILTATKLT